MGLSHDSYWDIYQDKVVHIASPVGQVQFMLTDYIHMANTHPKEWMLLCRFADTIQLETSEQSFRELRRLAEYLRNSAVDIRHSDVIPAAAIDVEKEIILRSCPDYGDGKGYDITPAARMLKDYERNTPVFTQAERNLVLRYAYYIGNTPGRERLAEKIATHSLSNRDIADVCASIEKVELAWSGLEKIEGIEIVTTNRPTRRFSFKNCEDPLKIYPRFALYPGTVPKDAVLLQSGVILQPCHDDMDYWRSDILKIDQTYVAPRYYIQIAHNRYEMTERIDKAYDLDVLQSGEENFSSPCAPASGKPSVLEHLREALQESHQHPPIEGRSKGDEVR